MGTSGAVSLNPTELKAAFTRVRVDTVEACGAVSIRAIVFGADILTVRVLTTLRSGIHLITNISRAVNILRPATDWTDGILVADIKRKRLFSFTQTAAITARALIQTCLTITLRTALPESAAV